MARGRWQSSLFLVSILVAASGSSVADDRDDFFESRIRPILVNSCLRCHGEQKSSAQFRVDSRDALLKGGESGAAVTPEKPEESLLIRAVQRHDDVSAMPPDKDQALRPDQVAHLVTWIKEGAPWPAKAAPFEVARHWAFEPVRDVPIPQPRDPEWSLNSVDAFIRAKQEAANISPAPAVGKATLIRRATFDLTGLPPTPAEVRAFEEDSSPNAFATVVDRLLESPHYGEHWGRHWLDLVRYADTAGENSDHPLPHAWRYRNWVLRSFNQNKPYDEFIREQIAGDLLAAEGPVENYPDRIVATGYLAIARRFGHDIDKDMHLTLEDTIDTLGKSVLGLTVACARCHDHKFDPISARDYYGLYGIFESTKFAFPGCEPQQQPRDLVPMVSPANYTRTFKPLLDRAGELDTSIKRVSDELTTMARRLKEVAARRTTVLSTGVIDDGKSAAMTFENQADTHPAVFTVKRGDVLQLSITSRGNHGADTTLVDFSIAEAGRENRQWSVADLIDDFHHKNPRDDRFGNPAVWSYFDTRDGFSFLPERLDGIEGKKELKAWRNGDTPAIIVNTATEPVRVWTTLPGRSYFMHPGPAGPVAIAWRSPIDGDVTVSGRVTDAHPGGPDGVGWVLEHFQISTAAPTGTASEFEQEMQKAIRLRESLEEFRKQRADLAPQLDIPVAYAVVEGTARNTRLQKRGEPTDLGEEVPRKFLDILGGATLRDSASSGRRELADWLTSPANPLTARVFVNRVWQWHFGRGLVTTPNDFGSRGAAPSHPDLLDHLATGFVKSGWNIKQLHRQIMLTRTYQLGSAPGIHAPELYVSFPRRRLTAEEVRDGLLMISGRLDSAAADGHPFPAEATWSFTQHGPFAAEYDTLKRSVYVMQKRNRRTRFFSLFDGPDPNTSTPVRDVTIVPTQALFFLNDPMVHTSAQGLAQRLASAATDREKLDSAFRLVFGRVPTDAEANDAFEFLRENSWDALCRVLLSSNEFLFVD